MQEVFFSAEGMAVHQVQTRSAIRVEVGEVEVDVIVARLDVARVDIEKVDVLVVRVDKILVIVTEGVVTVTVMVGVTAVNVELIGWGSSVDAASAPISKPRQLTLAIVKNS